MPTSPCCPGAQQERDRLQTRRLRAAELFAVGLRQAQVARQLGVSRQSVSNWHARWRAGGTDALRSRGPSGPTPRLSDRQLGRVEQALLKGATANGFVGELWTLDRITSVIQWLTGVRHHPAHVWALLHHRLGWTVQRPNRRAAERDQDAIDHWVATEWPRIKANAHRRRACLVFFGESALSLTPNVRRTWAPRGCPPVLVYPFNWKRASMAAALLWDGLPAHRSSAMRQWIHRQRSWLVVERLPAYAPELNPVEGLWSSLKAVELANLTSPSLGEVIDQAQCGIQRVRRTPHLAFSFLRHAGLSVAG
jgi:transposase